MFTYILCESLKCILVIFIYYSRKKGDYYFPNSFGLSIFFYIGDKDQFSNVTDSKSYSIDLSRDMLRLAKDNQQKVAC